MEKRNSVLDIRARKGGEKITVLTAYTAPMARLLDPLVDMLLVGDSLGMVVYGFENTLPVTLDLMINHGRAVAENSRKALVVVDMPFGSYQASCEQAFLSASRVMQETGAQAVKLEGGGEMAETIYFLVERGIPVMGHVGLMPQRVNALGGYKFQGRDDDAAQDIFQDALAVQEAGAFSMVIEGVKETVAREISEKLEIPTIGIGASPACDGQVLVIDDMLGFGEYVPSFVKRYADAPALIQKAVKEYVAEVKNGKFPSAEYCFPRKK